MSHLLHVSPLNSRVVQRQGVVPLMVEYAVPEETAPYLVVSSNSVLWLSEGYGSNPFVKSAVREVSLGDLFREVVEAVFVRGQEMQWGNVHPLSVEGLQAAVAHVMDYGLEPLELLIPRSHMSKADTKSGAPALRMPANMKSMLEDVSLPFRPSAWVPKDTIVVVPKDRTYVGSVSQVTSKKLSGVVHNASRAIAVVRG